MINSSNFIHISYTPDLTEGGIAYALRSLLYSIDDTSENIYDRLRRLVAEAAVELAFRRHLSQQAVPFDVTSAMPFTNPGKFFVELGRHRCDIKSFLVSRRDQISEIHRNPNVILNAPALVLSDHHMIDGHTDNDLYLFAFLSGVIAASQDDLKKVIKTNQPHYLMYAMPAAWRKPLKWNPLGPLVLKSESEAQLLIKISGQDGAREFFTRLVNLPSKTRVTIEDPFYSITSVHAKNMPSARLGIHSRAYPQTHMISAFDWGNIWVYGMQIILTGFIPRGEFRQRAKMLAPNSHVFQYDHTKTKNLAVPVSNLNPLEDRFTRVQEWKAAQA